MDKSCELLPPSEALPGFGDHSVIFHNGRGFYYACREFSASLEKRQFECVRLGCGVTAIMGPEVGSPLQDQGCHSHSHPADWDYRDKCLLLHTIKQRFLRDSSSASLILQEILSSLPTLKDEEENETTGDFESITIEEISPYELIKQEPFLDPIYENSEPELEESSILVQPSKTYSRVGRRKKLMSEQAPLKGEEEEKKEEEDNPALLVIKEEICERLGAQEESLANPIIQRTSIESLPRELRASVNKFAVNVQPQNQTIQPRNAKRRCTVCPRQKDIKTKFRCETCKKPMCRGHMKNVCEMCLSELTNQQNYEDV